MKNTNNKKVVFMGFVIPFVVIFIVMTLYYLNKSFEFNQIWKKVLLFSIVTGLVNGALNIWANSTIEKNEL